VINALTTHLATTSTADARSPLLDQIARRADVNRDGNVTSAEFSNFLSGLMESLEAEARNTAADPQTASTVPAPSTPELLKTVSSPSAAADALRRAIAAASKER
jgi:hypothetical protein